MNEVTILKEFADSVLNEEVASKTFCKFLVLMDCHKLCQGTESFRCFHCGYTGEVVPLVIAFQLDCSRKQRFRQPVQSRERFQWQKSAEVEGVTIAGTRRI